VSIRDLTSEALAKVPPVLSDAELDAAEAAFRASVKDHKCGVCGLEAREGCSGGFILCRYEADGYVPDRWNGTVAVRCKNADVALESEKLSRALDQAGVSHTIYAKSWADLDLTSDAWKVCHKYGERIKDVIHNGLNLVLVGARGTGKTQAATLLCAEALKSGFTALRLDWGKFTRKVRASYNGSGDSEDELVATAVGPDLLLLDDIGAGDKLSEHNERILTAVIGERYDRGRPSIITANLTRVELEKYLGARAADRINGASDWILFDGPQYRKRKEGERVADLVKEVRGK
jgi:DNA replication protein DnaC